MKLARRGVQLRLVLDVTRLTRAAFVARCLIEAVAAEHAPVNFNLQMLMDGRLDVPLDWNML